MNLNLIWQYQYPHRAEDKRDKCKMPSVRHTGDPTGQTEAWCGFCEQDTLGHLIKAITGWAQSPHKVFLCKGNTAKGSPPSSGQTAALSRAMHRNMLNSLFHQPQEQMLTIYPAKNCSHSFWTLLCIESIRDEYFLSSACVAVTFVHCEQRCWKSFTV